MIVVVFLERRSLYVDHADLVSPKTRSASCASATATISCGASATSPIQCTAVSWLFAYIFLQHHRSSTRYFRGRRNPIVSLLVQPSYNFNSNNQHNHIPSTLFFLRRCISCAPINRPIKRSFIQFSSSFHSHSSFTTIPPTSFTFLILSFFWVDT